MEGLYQSTESCDWNRLHYLALNNRDSEIRTMVLHTQQLSVRIPAVRKVTKDGTFKFSTKNGDTSLSVKEKQIIVCDIVSSLRLDLPFVSSLKCIEPSV